MVSNIFIDHDDATYSYDFGHAGNNCSLVANSSGSCNHHTRFLNSSDVANRGIELIVFYTQEAANWFVDSDNIEYKLKQHVNLFNDAPRAKGVTNYKASVC